MTIAGATLVALAIVGFWYASRYPTYLPPPGDQIDILLELAGVFPDKYQIMWREHGVLHSTDPVDPEDLQMLRGAEFLHNLTTGGAAHEGNLYVEVAYRFYAHDQQIPGESEVMCACESPSRVRVSCSGRLPFGNYEFSLDVRYNTAACTDPVDPQLVAEFNGSMQTARKLINLYLEPLRRKPRWL